ncbi:MAG: hypothetical protein HONBIEJF_02659 [Fimbriimonadaceae bacterium]|nr:hypothetical protein [Fimbriimonadaceae bacterium]
MRMKFALIPIALVVAIAAGCGGGGGTAVAGNNSYAGSYSGNYAVQALGGSGTMSLTISAAGAISGTNVDNNSGNGTITGTISDTGTVNAQVVYQTRTDMLSGTLTKNNQGQIVGNLTVVVNGQNATLSVTLSPTGGGGNSHAFSGSYSGSFVSGAGTGTVNSCTISADGTVAGTLTDEMGEKGTLSGTIQSNGVFQASGTYPTYSVTMSGTLSKNAQGQIVGTITVVYEGQSMSTTITLNPS